MADINKGLVPILRDIQSHWLWKYRPFSKGQAWIDMILLANFQDNKVPFEEGFIIVKRGEFITSQFKLADRWGWSRQQVRTFLKTLSSPRSIYSHGKLVGSDREMVRCQNLTNRATKLTIINYNELQKFPTKSVTNQQPTNNQPITINKNDKKEKNDKQKHLEFVYLTNQEYEKLIKAHGEPVIKEYIKKLNDYIGAKGVKYKSHYHTICMWLDKEPKSKARPLFK